MKNRKKICKIFKKQVKTLSYEEPTLFTLLKPDRLWFSSDRTRLHVYRLAVIESGQYTCKAENRAGSTELEIDVQA